MIGHWWLIGGHWWLIGGHSVVNWWSLVVIGGHWWLFVVIGG
jgi:hypothetical protein